MKSIKYGTRFRVLFLGMSFGVRFKVRTFGNKHPDGSNVHIFSDQVNIICTFTCMSLKEHS